MASELAGLIESTGYCRVLNDLREARLSCSSFGICGMPGIVDKQGVPLGCRRALLVADQSGDFQFLETASANVGQQVSIFTDLATALEWLNEG
jgi:hypothetical protein